jgi:dienelactone hydrolase
MTNNGARARALGAIATAALVALMSEDLGAQRTGSWSICGPGRYDLSVGGQSVGNETFDITCHPDGRYTGTGRTQLSGPGIGIDLTTHLELGADLIPASASAKGTVNGQPFDQTATFNDGTATLVSNGQSQTMPYAKGASWMGSNIFYTNAFIVARYDDAKGGAQSFPLFGAMSATLERLASDSVRLDNGESATFTRFAFRIAGQQITFWRDAAGRLAVMAIPPQKFTVVRPESAKWLPVLMSKLTGATAAPASAHAPSGDAIDYSAPAGASFTAEEVKLPVATYSLAGTLLVPKTGTRHPAAVMITGSGLQTRDQRIQLPGLEQYVPFRQIAERLAANGVAVLRMDDRGIGESTGRETLENATTTSLAEDTRAQVAWLRTRKDIDANRIVVIGHSEGASIAAMIGASDPKLAAVVMMAGVAKRGADVSFEQQEDMLRSDPTMPEATKQTLREKQKEVVKTVLAGGDIPGEKTNAWIREYFAYDPLPTARKVKQPLLILQGERDRQVYEAHAQLLADAVRGAGNRDVTVKVFPTLNHLFLPSTTGSFSEYSHLSTTRVPDDVLDVLTEWVKRKTAGK